MAHEEHSESAPHSEIKSVFFSYHFGEDKQLVLAIAKCVERQGLELVTGERLGGDEVPSAVKNRIRNAGSLVALLTRRYRIGEPKMKLWDTHPWVRDELTYGYQLGKPAIAIVESGVEVAGAFSTYERITFESERWELAIDKLQETLLLWTGQLGAKSIKVHLFGDEALKQLAPTRRPQGRYRWWSPPSVPEEWASVDLLYSPGGAYFLARRPPDENALIEFQVLEDGEPEWMSAWTGLEVRLQLFPLA